MKYFSTLILILLCSISTAQNLPDSRQTSYYTYIPAKIEMMYFPTFNANNGIKKVTVL